MPVKLSRTQKIATLFMISITLVILAVDVCLELQPGGNQNSISWLMRYYGHRWPVIAFAWGFLMGHFWGSFSGPDTQPPLSVQQQYRNGGISIQAGSPCPPVADCGNEKRAEGRRHD